MSGKVTPKEFFRMEGKVLGELWKECRGETMAIIILAMLSAGGQLVEPKFLEYITNAVSGWTEGKGAFGDIAAAAVSFLLILLLLKILSCASDIITEKYRSKTAAMAEKKIAGKLARIPYECYESSGFYDKINLARQASGKYWSAVWGITRMAVIVLMLAAYAVMLYRINALAVAVLYLSLILCTAAATKVSDLQTAYWWDHVSPVERRSSYFRHILGDRVSQQNIQASRSLPYFGAKHACYNKQELQECVRLNTFTFSTDLGAVPGDILCRFV